MARNKSTNNNADDVVADLISGMEKKGSATKPHRQGDHETYSCGIKIPHLAFQWLIGGSSHLPIQRFVGVSGLPKSFKSTLIIEMGNWILNQGGIHVTLDNEGKTSATMLDAMTRYDQKTKELASKKRVFKETNSVEEWQEQVSTVVKYARKHADAPKGSRIPIFITIDSLNGRSAASSQEKIMKEGSAEDRGFPVEAMKISRYLKALHLSGTVANLGYVQHLVQDLSSPPGYNGPNYKESGAVIASYAGSIQIRVNKGGAWGPKATHPAAPVASGGQSVQGYTLWLVAERGCVGPDKRKLPVDILWQYVDDENGVPVQYMWYDWDGALGNLLINMRYSEKTEMNAFERGRLDKALHFVQVAGGKGKGIKCEELGLEGASATEFGRAIRENPEVYAKVSKALNIAPMPDFQDADADAFGAPPADDEEEEE